MDCSTPSFPVHHQPPELAPTHANPVGEAIQPSHPLVSPSPPAFSLSRHQGLFQWVSSSHQVAKVFELQQQSFQCISGLISFRIDCFDLLVLQGTLKSVLWHHNSQASVLGCSAFFVIQFSHPYITTRKTIALALQTKMISLLFNMLSRFFMAFLPRSNHLLINHTCAVLCVTAQSCLTLCDPMDRSQAPLSMGFSRQQYWSGLPCPPPGDLFNPGIEPRCPALQGDSLPS